MKSAIHNQRKWIKWIAFLFHIKLRRKTPISVACIPNPFIHLPWLQMGLKHSKSTPPTAPSPIYIKPPWKTLKILQILEEEGGPQESPCMYEKEALNSPTKPWLEEDSHSLPLQALDKKRSLKNGEILAEVLHKWCLWEAQEMRKIMVELDFRFTLRSRDMQRPRGERRKALFLFQLKFWNG